jgi:hypothetical protein
MNGPLFNSIEGASFGEPQSADDTSAPPEAANVQPVQDTPIQNPLARLLAKKSKQQKKQKQSPALLAAIRRSRSARSSSERFG